MHACTHQKLVRACSSVVSFDSDLILTLASSKSNGSKGGESGSKREDTAFKRLSGGVLPPYSSSTERVATGASAAAEAGRQAGHPTTSAHCQQTGREGSSYCPGTTAIRLLSM